MKTNLFTPNRLVFKGPDAPTPREAAPMNEAVKEFAAKTGTPDVKKGDVERAHTEAIAKVEDSFNKLDPATKKGLLKYKGEVIKKLDDIKTAFDGKMNAAKA